jgi:hypothetical protein
MSFSSREYTPDKCYPKCHQMSLKCYLVQGITHMTTVNPKCHLVQGNKHLTNVHPQFNSRGNTVQYIVDICPVS